MKVSFVILIVLTVIIDKICEKEREAKGKGQNAIKVSTKGGTKNETNGKQWRNKWDDEEEEEEEEEELSSDEDEELSSDEEEEEEEDEEEDDLTSDEEEEEEMKAVLDGASGIGTAQSKAENAKNITCGKVKASTMLQLQYNSIIDETKKQIFRADKPYKSEKFELAFIGFTGEAKGGGALPKGKCVTVKTVEMDDQRDDSEEAHNDQWADERQLRSRAEKLIEERKFNEFYVLGQVQENIEPNLRRHLVEMFDLGDMKTPQNSRMRVLTSVTELTNDGFHEWVYGKNTYFDDDEEFAEQISEIMWPIREFHQMAMHLDIRPKSYVYVRIKRGKELLKLTNFGNSEIIPIEMTKKSANRQKRANLAKEPSEFHKFMPEYASPEFQLVDGKAASIVSPKSDMWALGIMLIELLILQSPSFYHLREGAEQRDKLEADVRQRLLEIGALYKGFTVDNKNGRILPIDFEEYQWPYAFWDALYDILRIWRHFPRTALLITNLLDPKWRRRMTAKGVIDYLDAKCYPPELEEQMNGGEIRLFNGLNADEFIAKIEEKIEVAEKRRNALGEGISRLLGKGGGDAQRLPVGVKQQIEQKHASRVTLSKNIHKWRRLRHWLGEALEKRAEALAEMFGTAPKGGRQKGTAQRGPMLGQCDTETTALDTSEVPDTDSTEQSHPPLLEGRNRMALAKVAAMPNKQQKEQPNLKRKMKEEEKRNAQFEWPNKKEKRARLGEWANEQKGTPEGPTELNRRRAEEWQRIREEIGKFERLQRDGKLAAMPIYEQCVKSVKVDIREVKKLSEKYGAIGKWNAPGENVPNPPTMAKDAVRRQTNRATTVPMRRKTVPKMKGVKNGQKTK